MYCQKKEAEGQNQSLVVNLAVERMHLGLKMAVLGVLCIGMGMADIVGGRICLDMLSYSGLARTPSVRPST